MYKYSKNNLVNSTNSYKTIYKKYKWPESIERWSNCPIWRSRNYGRPSPYLSWACLPLGWAWSVFHRTLRMLPGLFLKVYQKQNSLGPHSWELHYGWCNLPVLQEQKHRSGPPCASGRSCALGFRKPEIKVRPGLVCASDKDLTVRPSMCFRKKTNLASSKTSSSAKSEILKQCSHSCAPRNPDAQSIIVWAANLLHL